MSYPIEHNLNELRRPLIGFGQHISQQPVADKRARIEHLRQIVLDAGRELEQLLAEEG